MLDAPIATPDGKTEYLTEAFAKDRRRFTLVAFANGATIDPPHDVDVIRIGEHYSDSAGLARARYDAGPGTAYLFRPDGYVAARFRSPTRGALEAAIARASGRS
jgi:3-(3-hydroxy-phenyl)propionate hydroxylase